MTSGGTDDRIKVVYIAGFGRSGSTILGNVLGELDGFFHAGELNFIWEHNFVEDRLCSCGAAFSECRLWGHIVREAYGGLGEVDAGEMVRLSALGTRTRHVLPMLSAAGRRYLYSRLGKYPERLHRLYRTTKDVTGSRVIVDSSKAPPYGYLLGGLPGVDLYAVHLVRDPRAAAFSWLRKKVQPDRKERSYLPEIGVVKSALIWTSWNAAAEALWRRTPEHYLRIRYEDFVEDPQSSVKDILDMVGEEKPLYPRPFTGERSVKLGESHTVAGNPNRFQTGDVTLKSDDEWAARMRSRDRRLVTALTFPLLARYGYPRGFPPRVGDRV